MMDLTKPDGTRGARKRRAYVRPSLTWNSFRLRAVSYTLLVLLLTTVSTRVARTLWFEILM